jgi:uridine monophosphate synthetase
MSADKAALCRDLHALGAVKFGQFTLKSGATSPVYIDLRLLVSAPPLLASIARAYADILSDLTYDRLAAIPYAALPIGTAVALATGRPLVYPRKEVKEHGTRQAIEGLYRPGETVVVIDDLISSGESKLEAIAPLEAAGLVVRDVVVLIDRLGGGGQVLQERGYRLHSVLTLTDVADILSAGGQLTETQASAVKDYIGQGSW